MAELTPEQITRAERARKGHEARKAREQQKRLTTIAPDAPLDLGLTAEDIPEPEPIIPQATPATARGEVRTIHFVDDGLTALGKVWYRGEQISVDTASDDYQMTVDRLGRSWLDFDEVTQVERYGKVMFRPGPWPYQRPMTEGEYEASLSAVDAEAAHRLEKQRQRQQRVAPPGSGSR